MKPVLCANLAVLADAVCAKWGLFDECWELALELLQDVRDL